MMKIATARKEDEMRVIEWRAKDKHTGDWCYGFPFKATDGHWCLKSGAYTHHVDPDTLGQFTGLYDKEGLPIYEGDLFGFEDDPAIEVIKWSEKKAMFAHSSIFPNYTYELTIESPHTDFWVRKGNIHDNPEFVEGAIKIWEMSRKE